jgi:hypothetical protein
MVIQFKFTLSHFFPGSIYISNPTLNQKAESFLQMSPVRGAGGLEVIACRGICREQKRSRAWVSMASYTK